jgi:glycerophosphoryl diester phosphodiesterase
MATELDCYAVVFNYKLLSPEVVSQVHAADLRCLAYTVNAPECAEQLPVWQVDGLITDGVDLLDPTRKAAERATSAKRAW